MLDVVSRSDLVMGLCGQEEATVDVPYRKLLVVFSTDNLPLVHTDTGFNVGVHFLEGNNDHACSQRMTVLVIWK